ncbi:transcription elongation factor SPT6-like [Drosophila willistoni]|uniref:transcription elongation factor SPT6-like n=1 Tax=Drosophila willistoni TaxID=7260 RepID=UPI001F078D25|nr:transcription elongation factor SPT6-like [Drosophila willistoni]
MTVNENTVPEYNKRKKLNSKDLDCTGLEEDDYELLEENLGVKVNRHKRYKRLRDNNGSESDEEDGVDQGVAREKIAQEIFFDNMDDEVSHERHNERNSQKIRNDDDEDSDSTTYDFVVDDHERPITEKISRPMHIDP